ncbi:MAG: UDP-N-acetylmuramoyl-tripeptide--D-alanyl-D-alanine ligase [Propionibacteriaceae bacterium]
MNKLTLKAVADAVNGRLAIPSNMQDTLTDISAPDVVIDSRLVTAGALFVAIAGEHVDGHDFVASAANQGAIGAVVEQEVSVDIPQIIVADTVQALTQLARWSVKELVDKGLAIVGITGSSGKTTTKDMTAQILEVIGETVSPVGSFNNEIGLPLTATKCAANTKFFVAEMGAQRVGDISALCSIAPPKVGVVLNVGHAHLGEFGGVENIVEAKGELVAALPVDGFAVLNAQDKQVWSMRHRTQAQIIATAVGERPQHNLCVWATDIVPDGEQRYSFTLHNDFDKTNHQVQLPLTGEHMVVDAVAAAAAAFALGINSAAIAESLRSLTVRSRWRMAVKEAPAGVLVINDAYNANPESMRAALATVLALRQERRIKDPKVRSWAVLGEMMELGEESAVQHQLVGKLASEVDEVIAIGQYADYLVQGAGHGRVVTHADAARVIIEEEAAIGDLILVKGSNSTRLGLLGDELSGLLQVGKVSQ